MHEKCILWHLSLLSLHFNLIKNYLGLIKFRVFSLQFDRLHPQKANVLKNWI